MVAIFKKMNNIVEKQNNEKFIQYLKAQRIAYSQCKIYKTFDFISILIAIILPLIGVFKNELLDYLAAFGVLWTVIYLISDSYRKRKTVEGAKIQEQFDIELFSIPWNKILCKSKINSDKITDLAKKYEKQDLKNWYSKEIKDDLPKEIAVLLCQRINFSWELNLRKKYVRCY
ncbi:hypothetical protein SAMN04487907_1221 [Zunongwangia mangrovi]|uniref:Uncharacterized protein n=1 Tax=Zunongwangia mangrovi TaxID=1334022 RepID=A0A1I1NAT3_9FLAO|nr:hypothetical protein SAMN04487907_1221 [Zunongwangia mangrovi]